MRARFLKHEKLKRSQVVNGWLPKIVCAIDGLGSEHVERIYKDAGNSLLSQTSMNGTVNGRRHEIYKFLKHNDEPGYYKVKQIVLFCPERYISARYLYYLGETDFKHIDKVLFRANLREINFDTAKFFKIISTIADLDDDVIITLVLIPDELTEPRKGYIHNILAWLGLCSKSNGLIRRKNSFAPSLTAHKEKH
jgi:hypothetical protein